MRVIILGSAAGGGVPQWNCGCRNCTEARHTNRSRTQSSVAVSADGERWILLNASPDLRTQLAAHRSLWPPSGSRATPLRAVVLTDGEIDHTLGLLLLRESADRLPVYAPAGVMGHLPIGGPGGSLELLPQLDAKRVVLVHLNNTNPILCRSSAERARVEAAGIVVGEDAMEFEL